MVGDLEKSSFSNIEQQSLEFVKYTLDPWVIRWEQALKKSLFLQEEEGGNLYLVNGAMTRLKDAGAFAKEGTESTSEENEPQQPPDNRNRGGLR